MVAAALFGHVVTLRKLMASGAPRSPAVAAPATY